MATQVSESAKQFLGVESFSDTDLEAVQSLTIPSGCNYIMIQAEILQEVVDEQFQAASCWDLIPSMN